MPREDPSDLRRRAEQAVAAAEAWWSAEPLAPNGLPYFDASFNAGLLALSEAEPRVRDAERYALAATTALEVSRFESEAADPDALAFAEVRHGHLLGRWEGARGNPEMAHSLYGDAIARIQGLLGADPGNARFQAEAAELHRLREEASRAGQ